MINPYLNRRVRQSQNEVYLDDNQGTQGAVTTVENHIYFYESVSPKSVMHLGIAIQNLNDQIIQISQNLGLNQAPAIHLHINSYGGDAFAGLAGASHILNSQVPVITYVEGSVASAGTMLSVVGAKRYITEHSFFLIHQVSTGLWGTYENLKDEKESMDSLMEMIESVYLKHTEMKKKELKKLLKRDLWLNPKQCLQHGLVDEIIKYERV